jgi:hypothetical protein
MAFDLVMKHQTGGAEGDQGDYPEGNFKTAWLALEKKYNPKTIMMSCSQRRLVPILMAKSVCLVVK